MFHLFARRDLACNLPRYRANLQGEVDGAALYRALADAEADPRIKEVYGRLAAVIRDPRIAKFMEADLDAKSQWPDPWLSLNPFFAGGGSVADLAGSELHPECARIFQAGKTSGGTVCDGRPIRFYQHQREAIQAGTAHSVEEIGSALRAGTNCGSCRPEIARRLAAHPQPGTTSIAA